MLKLHCHRKGCERTRSEFRLFLNRRCPPSLGGRSYCSDSCLLAQLDQEITGKWDLVHGQKALKIPRPKIGTILLQSQYLTREQLDAAIALQLSSHEARLGELLVWLGYVEERQITLALAKQWGMPMIDLQHCEIQRNAVRALPGKVAMCGRLIPVGYDGSRGTLRIAAGNPIEPGARAALCRMLKREIEIYVADQSAVRAATERFYPASEIDIGKCSTFGTRGELAALVRQAVRSAMRARAEDIRFELMEDYAWLRVDLQDMAKHEVFRYTLPWSTQPAVEHAKAARLMYAAAQ
ncbi:MAG: hypothetical protein HXY20_07455 [Acidobacteria bacterium]|nr:hypothetical protein [Acidobacteriota bacterium]